MRSIPCCDLSEADFAGNGVWRFALPSERDENADETHVLPDPGGLRLGTYGSFVVRARYALSNGGSAPGAVQVDILNAKAFFTPAFIFFDGKAFDPYSSEEGHPRAESWTLTEYFAGEARPRSGRIFHSTLIQLLGVILKLFKLRFARG
jgi:hypothetical protein